MLGRLLIKSFVLTTNIVFILALLFAIAASHISPEKFIVPAFFILAFPYLVIINIGYVVFWVLARKWYLIFSLIALIYALPQISTLFPVHYGKLNYTEKLKTIKVLSFNTMLNSMMQKHSEKNPNPVIKYILSENADLVCLQEFAVSPKNKYLTNYDISKAFSQIYPYTHIRYKQKNKWSRVGIATFSKYPIVAKDTLYFDSSYNLGQYTDININGQIIRLINVHLESNKLSKIDKAMPEELKKEFNTEKLSGTTKFFSHKLGLGYRLRAVQADTIKSLINKTKSKIILCGDFNDIPLSYAYTQARSTLKDAFAETGSGFGWTFNESIFRFRIDYIFYSPEFSSSGFTIGREKISDHYPVTCKIKIN